MLTDLVVVKLRQRADRVIDYRTLAEQRLKAGNWHGARLALVQAEVEAEGAWELALQTKGRV